MRMLTGTVGLAAATLLSCITSVASTPNYEVAKTKVEVDRHREKLDNGELVVRIQRTQDLFSDATAEAEAHLLLERDTHLLLRIQLDADNGRINVNDAPLDLNTAKAAPITVAGLKADTYRLPQGHDSPVTSPQELEGLIDQMSRGLVSVEVKVESEPISPSVPAVYVKSNDDGVSEPTVGAITIRKVGLWLRITEVEGKTIPHTTAIYTPILQLIVTGSDDKIDKISTLAIGGKPPVEETAHHMPGPAMVKGLPPVEDGALRGRIGGGKGEPRPHHPHHDDAGRQPGMLGWLARTLDLSRWARPSRFTQGKASARRPCHGRKMTIKGLHKEGDHEEMNAHTSESKVVGHRPMLENPFSGTMDDVEDDQHPAGSVGNGMRGGHRMHGQHHGHRYHRHGHRKHGKCGAFFHSMAVGLVYGFAMIGNVLLHPATVLTVSCLLTAAVAFHVVRRVVMKRRGGQVRLDDGSDGGYDDAKYGSESGSDVTEPLFVSEKEKEAGLHEVVVVDQTEPLPRYEDRS